MQPLEFRRNQDFFISSKIELNCSDSLSTITQWIINNCTLNCSSLPNIDSRVITNYGELFIPAQTLSYGLYELNLKVMMTVSTNLTASASAFVRITSSNITVNLVRLGTSRITHGYEQDLILQPGKYSVHHDYDRFEASVSR